ncbi:MAG: nitroreductase family protein [Planctomycetes bacterium]|nr:nitroreductase family protein [Planctomycetota bacterium]
MLAEIKKRRAIREYYDGKIPDKDMEGIINSALMAPSPFNAQPWKFYVVKDKQKKFRIRNIYDDSTKKIQLYKKLCLTRVPIYEQDTSFLEIATLIIPCYEIKTSYARDSLAMAVQNLMLEATRRNIATVCMGRPTRFKKQRDQMRKIIQLENSHDIPYIIAIGYAPKPHEEYEIPERKPIKEIMVQI